MMVRSGLGACAARAARTARTQGPYAPGGLWAPARLFCATPAASLLYKRATPLKKAPQSSQDAAAPPAGVDPDALVGLEANKWYQRTPRVLRGHIRSMLLRPAGFVLAIALLQQAFSIGPFLGFWYAFDAWGVSPPPLPEDLLATARAMMDTGLVNWDDAVGDRARAQEAGAQAYALVKLCSPLVWVGAIWLAPGFERRALRPLTHIARALWAKLRPAKKA